MKLYELFSNRVKELCSDVRYQMCQDPTLRNTALTERINEVYSNLEAVISGAMQPNLDIQYRRQPFIGPDVSSSRSKQEHASLQGNVSTSTVGEPPQKYGLIIPIIPIL